nr:MAG TPA: hypothetical protein [Caudoviricetes sp.]
MSSNINSSSIRERYELVFENIIFLFIVNSQVTLNSFSIDFAIL